MTASGPISSARSSAAYPPLCAVVVERCRVDDADAAQESERWIPLRDGRWAAWRASPSRRARMPAASTGAALAIRDASPAAVISAAGARSHSRGRGTPPPGHRGRHRPPVRSSAQGPHMSSPASRHAMSSQTWATTGGRGGGEQRVERRDAVRLGRCHGKPATYVVECRLADPAHPILDRMECRGAAGPAARAWRARLGPRGLRRWVAADRRPSPTREDPGRHRPPFARRGRRGPDDVQVPFRV